MTNFVVLDTITNQIVDVLDDECNAIPPDAIAISPEQLGILNRHPNGFSICDYVNGEIIINAERSAAYELEVCKENKELDIKNYALVLINSVIPGVRSFDDIQLAREQWLSIDPAARNSTVNFQYAIDVHQAAYSGVSSVNALTTVAEVTSFDPDIDITWPTAP